ncbi:MAG TPA: cysteine desulfurase family protein [Lacipirellulaceae bacterium]|nr:cysteine desulfurase family protein [Lacipirellulaceae bacterium]
MIYLDCHATTPVDPRVVQAMLPYFTEQFGNAGSVHAAGETAREAVADAAARLARLIGAEPDEIVFTSGATESNNLAIRGVAEHRRRRGDHVVSVHTEHKAVLDPLARLERKGFRVTLLEVEPHGSPRAGWLAPQRVADALAADTALVSVMLANNEIGVIQPLAEIAAVCRDAGVLLHCDATQAVGKIPVDVRRLGVDLMSFTAHKMYGPKGVGVLYVRGGAPLGRPAPPISGGGPQRGPRGGALDGPGIVVFGPAAELAVQELPAESPRVADLRDELWRRLNDGLEGIALCGPPLDGLDRDALPLRLPNNLNVALHDVDGEALVLHTPELAISTGATCSAADPEPSHVMLALGMSADAARSTVRFGLGRFTTDDEIARAADLVVEAARRLRGMI